MARLLPSKRIGKIPPETARVVHAASRIPGDDFIVWTSMPVADGARPELMLLHEERSCWLVSISPASEARVATAVQRALFTGGDEGNLEAADLGLVERGLLNDFHQLVLAEAGVADPSAIEVHKVIAFPNVPQALLDEVARLGGVAGFRLWGSEMMRSDALAAEIRAAGPGRLPGEIVHCLRRRFTPESVIPETFVPRLANGSVRPLVPALGGYLLDLDQEWLVKDDLLSPEAESVIEDFRVRLVTGVAGSGKSLVLLYRAMLQARLRPGARILVLTHNRPLHGELQERFRRLCPDGRVEWRTFYQWCHRMRRPLAAISNRNRETLAANFARADVRLARLPVEFLLGEIDWMKDNALTARASYLAAARTGRKRPLSDPQRQAVFDFFENYEAALRARRQQDWTGIALSIREALAAGAIAVPHYDFVFIDEAQFFAPVWFDIVKRAVRPGAGQLFLAADPTQGFLKRRQSWLASGLDVRGHATRLRRSYRNTRTILEFASRFYRTRLLEDDEEINLPDRDDLLRIEAGLPPEHIRVADGFHEICRVRNEILAAIRRGADPGHFLVIHASAAMAHQLACLFNQQAVRPSACLLGRHAVPGAGQVRIASLNAATGLEAPVVFLCGLGRLFEEENRLGLESADLEELIRDNTRLIYMGMTRARQRLVITCPARSDAAARLGFAPAPDRIAAAMAA